MTKQNKAFGKLTEERIKELVGNAEVHKETHHISFQVPEALTEKKEIKFGTQLEVVEHAVDLINGYGLAVEGATNELAHTHFPDSKHETWDGRLQLFEGMTINSDVRLREVVGEETLYGTTQTFIDHPHSQEMVDWYSGFRDRNVELAQTLFKD